MPTELSDEEKEKILIAVANLLYAAGDLLEKVGEKNSIELGWRLENIANGLDGVENMETKPYNNYSDEEKITSLKIYRRTTKDLQEKRAINKIIQAIENGEMNFRHEHLVPEFLGEVPKIKLRKENKKLFVNRAFTDWFKNSY